MTLSLSFPLRSIFLAIPLVNDAKAEFQRLKFLLQPFADCLRFQNPGTAHLTLQYWREMMEIEYAPMLQQTRKIASRHTPFSLQITSAETFGIRGKDSVLYLAVAFSPELAVLKKDCPWAADRPFSPHVTLARIGHPGRFAVHRKKIMKALSGASFPMDVDRIGVYAQTGGIKQTRLHSFALAG